MTKGKLLPLDEVFRRYELRMRRPMITMKVGGAITMMFGISSAGIMSARYGLQGNEYALLILFGAIVPIYAYCIFTIKNSRRELIAIKRDLGE